MTEQKPLDLKQVREAVAPNLGRFEREVSYHLSKAWEALESEQPSQGVAGRLEEIQSDLEKAIEIIRRL